MSSELITIKEMKSISISKCDVLYLRESGLPAIAQCLRIASHCLFKCAIAVCPLSRRFHQLRLTLLLRDSGLPAIAQIVLTESRAVVAR